MKNPFSVVKDFEDAVAEYCGAPYCVAVSSCTAAIQLCLEYHNENWDFSLKEEIEIPKYTYVSVPMQIKRAGFKIKFREEDWKGAYELAPIQVYDSARLFTSDMYKDFREHARFGTSFTYVCLSFHWSKVLGIQQGGAILHNNVRADEYLRKARFDGRTEGVAPKNDTFNVLGAHCYMSPEIAAEGLVRLHHLPKHNKPLQNDDYPDLSKIELFQ